MLKNRRGFTLFESLLALMIVCGITLFGCYQLEAKQSGNWRNFEREFHYKFIQLLAREAQFSVRTNGNHKLWLAETSICLPANWQIVNEGFFTVIRREGLGTRPATLKFKEGLSGRTKKLVFQLGGGTYDFR
jgi:prepilin-type N-terminal cleavage/methylation domain-containing protein